MQVKCICKCHEAAGFWADMARLAILCLGLCAFGVHPVAAAIEAVDTTEYPVTLPLGFMMGLLAFLAVPFHFLKQSNIIAW